jgi:hypothetical protein
MEKRTPHCKLAVVKDLVAAGRVRATFSALAGGAALGFGFEEIIGVVTALMPRDFYKSMTTHADHARMAGRLPAKDAGRRGVPEAHCHRRRADRVVQGVMKEGVIP